MSTERIDIEIREDGSRVVKRDIEEVGNAAQKASGQVITLQIMLNQAGSAALRAGGNFHIAQGGILGLGSSMYYLKRAIYALGAGLFLKELKEYIDTWIGIENSIRLS